MRERSWEEFFRWQVFGRVEAADDTFRALGVATGAPTLSSFDLFHAHLLRVHGERGVVAALLHAREYPAYCESNFPFALGTHQEDSPLVAASADDARAMMATRNVLWAADTRRQHIAMAVLDARCRDVDAMVLDIHKEVFTVDERCVGDVVCDIYCLPRDADLGRFAVFVS